MRAPSGAPHVVVVLIDDMGFGASTPYGGPCEMPTAQRLADEGLRYSRFHVTSLCSPTRQALLTGRNHHSVGMGVTSEMSTPEPGYHGFRPASAATIAQILGGNGYSTSAFGKWHQTPPVEVSPSGPFTRWPTGEGFDHFYGFMGAEMNHWYPQLFEGTRPVEPDRLPEDGYHLSEDLVDHAIDWVTTQQAITPDRPFFTYLALGATHAPFHVAPEWSDKYAGRFDAGWDAQREQILARQKAARHRARRRRSCRPGRRACRAGTSSTTPSAGSPPASWRSTPGSPSTPTCRSAASSTPSTSWACSTTRCSSTSSATTAPPARAGRAAPSASTWSGTGSRTTPPTWRPGSTSWATRRRTPSIPSAGRWP